MNNARTPPILHIIRSHLFENGDACCRLEAQVVLVRKLLELTKGNNQP
jgi:hypothetical protein